MRLAKRAAKGALRNNDRGGWIRRSKKLQLIKKGSLPILVEQQAFTSHPQMLNRQAYVLDSAGGVLSVLPQEWAPYS